MDEPAMVLKMFLWETLHIDFTVCLFPELVGSLCPTSLSLWCSHSKPGYSSSQFSQTEDTYPPISSSSAPRLGQSLSRILCQEVSSFGWLWVVLVCHSSPISVDAGLPARVAVGYVSSFSSDSTLNPRPCTSLHYLYLLINGPLT